MRSGTWLALACLGALATVGCAHRLDNKALEAPIAGHRLDDRAVAEERIGDLLVILTFSGGGHRASALSYGVLEELRDTRIPGPAGSGEARLLDEVDLISSVSGGSFTSAYYGLFGDRIFEDFHERFLKRDLESDVFWSLVTPRNLIRVSSGTFDRVNLAAEIYDGSIFEGRTFADLRAGGTRPFVVINATNVTTGCAFPFTQDTFDCLGSDLDAFPVAHAVAASSAVPILFSPITLVNHPGPEGLEAPARIREAVKHPDRRRRRVAKGLMVYHREKAGHPYVHLVDGGVADNTGLGFVLHHLRYGTLGPLVSRPVGAGGVRAALVIVVNAMNRLEDNLDRHENSPGFVTAGLYSMSASVDVNTTEVIQQMEEFVPRRDPEEPEEDARKPRPRLFVAEVAFTGLEDHRERREFEEMPTSLALEGEKVDALVAVARRILRGNPAFEGFLEVVRERPGGE